MFTHLTSIQSRHHLNGLADILFALFVALAVVISISTISTAATVASHVAAR